MPSINDRSPDVRGNFMLKNLIARPTWSRFGGPAGILFSPLHHQDLSANLADCPDNSPLFSVGSGSNFLVPHRGVPGFVTNLRTLLNAIPHAATRIFA